MVYAVILFWLLAGLAVFFLAMRGGPRGARESLHTESKVGQRAVTLGIVVLFAFGLAVPALVLAFNARDNEAAQDKQTGGWRYHPSEAGDTSVFGWQLMALQSAKLAGLKVDPGTLVAAQRWLAGVSSNGIDGNPRGRYSYQAGIPPSPAISSVGLLCIQWLGVDRQDLRVTGGVQFLLANLPDENAHDVISWFYASQALHNMDDRDWDTWRRKMRRLLVTTQSREGCAAGSWDPQRPAPDAWWGGGGRLMVTSLSCLILELDYRYLPLFGRSRLWAAR